MTDLVGLQQAIASELARIPGIQTVTVLPQRLDHITVPALLLDCVEITPAEDRGTGELLLDSHWELRLVGSEQQAKIILLQLLQAVLLKLQQQYWGLADVGPVKLKHAALDHFTPLLAGHTIWLMEWTQTLALGECVWDVTTVVPERLIVRDEHAS